ncbi:MAG: 16S rRNA methyltransferase [Desulfurococcaceae archaeon]
MRQLILLLLEASLETVPSSIVHHPSVVKTAKRRSKKPLEMLLDVSLHYHAMRDLPKREKRGRPDIVHVSLLEALESPLCKNNLLKIGVHTIGGHAIFVDSSTRIPKNYNRFVGLMEQLFKYGKVPPNAENPLLYVKTIELKHFLRELGARGLILLREVCEYKPLPEIVKQAVADKMAIGIGAFPHGDFEESTLKEANYCYSIYSKPLSTLIVVSRVISSAERTFGLMEL